MVNSEVIKKQIRINGWIYVPIQVFHGYYHFGEIPICDIDFCKLPHMNEELVYIIKNTICMTETSILKKYNLKGM